MSGKMKKKTNLTKYESKRDKIKETTKKKDELKKIIKKNDERSKAKKLKKCQKSDKLPLDKRNI